uniref:Uncharacterized protein n=1 Tax=Arundo donax TaxID=35708 RepID=A0A0A8YHQ5_ARUDO
MIEWRMGLGVARAKRILAMMIKSFKTEKACQKKLSL